MEGLQGSPLRSVKDTLLPARRCILLYPLCSPSGCSVFLLLCRILYRQTINMAFTDAALPPDDQSISSRFAGLGVVLDLTASPHHCRLRVHAKALVKSVLMGEIAALMVAAKVANLLQVQSISLASDCQQAV
ncbi:unnamed protein product [Urochloa humidicola]